MSWRQELRGRLAGRRFAVLCLGARGMGDDAAGPLVAEKLRRLGVPVEEAAVALDAVGRLRELKPEAVVLVDAVLGGEPGEIVILSPSDLDEALPMASTHRVPPRLLEEALGVEVVVVGIAAGRIEPGAPPGPRVVEAAEKLAEELARLSRAHR